MKLTYEAILNDPSLLERLEKQAHRERAKAVHFLVIEPIKSLFADHNVHRAPAEACSTSR